MASCPSKKSSTTPRTHEPRRSRWAELSSVPFASAKRTVTVFWGTGRAMSCSASGGSAVQRLEPGLCAGPHGSGSGGRATFREIVDVKDAAPFPRGRALAVAEAPSLAAAIFTVEGARCGTFVRRPLRPVCSPPMVDASSDGGDAGPE